MKTFLLIIWHLLTVGNTCIECGRFLTDGKCLYCDDIDED